MSGDGGRVKFFFNSALVLFLTTDQALKDGHPYVIRTRVEMVRNKRTLMGHAHFSYPPVSLFPLQAAMAEMFFGRSGVTAFYAVIAIYLYGILLEMTSG